MQATRDLAEPARPDAGAQARSAPAGHIGCEPEGLRERKKAATRRALGIAAMRLAVERGLENVLIEDIAAEAGVSARTFSNYFGSKHEAICAVATDRGRRIGEALRGRPPGEPLMDAITHAVLDQYASAEHPPDRDWAAGVRLAFASPALQGEHLRAQHAVQQALAEAIADRIGADADTDLFPAVVASAVAAATHVAIGRWLRADPPTALAPLIRLALSQLSLIRCEHANSEPDCGHPPGGGVWPDPGPDPRPGPAA
jgi:AcrR family transcriptional regulator